MKERMLSLDVIHLWFIVFGGMNGLASSAWLPFYQEKMRSILEGN